LLKNDSGDGFIFELLFFFSSFSLFSTQFIFFLRCFFRTKPGSVYGWVRLKLRLVRERMVALVQRLLGEDVQPKGQDSDYNKEVRAISGRVTSIHPTEGFEAPSDKGQTLHPPGV